MKKKKMSLLGPVLVALLVSGGSIATMATSIVEHVKDNYYQKR